MFTANYPSLMLGVNKPGTVVTVTLPTLAASYAGQDLNQCILLLPSRRALSGVSSLGFSQAGFAPKSPGIAEQSARSGCSWGALSAGDPRWPPAQPLLQPSHGVLGADQCFTESKKATQGVSSN